MAGVAALKETQLNPGVADPSKFRSVSYKGGSEPGVLNLTTQVTSLTGRTYCVSATWTSQDQHNISRLHNAPTHLPPAPQSWPQWCRRCRRRARPWRRQPPRKS